MTQTIIKKIFKVQGIQTAKFLYLPQQFVVARGIEKGDMFEAMFTGNSSIIVYRKISVTEIQREIANAKKYLEASG